MKPLGMSRHLTFSLAQAVTVLGLALGCAHARSEPFAPAEANPVEVRGNTPAAKAVPVASAQDADAAEAKERAAPIVEEQADVILRTMAEYLGTAPGFTFHAEVTTENVILTNIKVQTTASVDVGLRRPNGLYVEYVGDLEQRRLWFDGLTFTVLDGVHNVYGQVPVPTSLDKTLKELREKYGARIPLSYLVINNPYTEIMEKVNFGFYIGLRNIQGIRCHHLLYVTDNVDFQIWIEDGAQFVPRKIVVTYKHEPEAPQYTAILSDWDFAPRLSKYLFVAKTPADAVKIDFLELKRGMSSAIDTD